MPSHPSLRIHSPRPDIEDVANHRATFRIAERVCIRITSLMLVVSIFCILLTVLTNSIYIALGAFVTMLLAYVFNGCANRLREGREETPTRYDTPMKIEEP
jgi:hypothetical protein